MSLLFEDERQEKALRWVLEYIAKTRPNAKTQGEQILALAASFATEQGVGEDFWEHIYSQALTTTPLP